MNLTYEANYHQLEEQHRWFAGRRDAVDDLSRPLKLPTTAAILEIGCSGGLLNQLLLSWVRAENAVLRHVNLPMGVSVFALAQKPA